MSGAGGNDLFRAWLQAYASVAASGSLDPGTAAGEITTKLKKSLEDEWEELKTSLEQPGSTEISSLCASVGSLVEGVWTDQKEAYLKNLCKGIVEIKYFMSGVETKREDKGRGGKDETAQIKQLTDAQAYPRCIVGSVALNELYGDHCKLDGIIGEISTTMNNKLRGYPTQNGQSAEDQLNKCQGITKEQLFIGKSIIGNTIKLWAEGDRAKEERKKSRDQTGGALRVGYVWRYWPNVCGGKGKQKEEQHLRELRRNNAKHMMSFLTVGDDNMSSGADTDGKPTLGEILTDDSYTVEKDQLNSVLSVLVEGSTGEVDTSKLPTLMQTLETISKETKAEVCMKQEGKTLCQRLECAKDYWKLNNTGQQQQNFWDIYVKGKVENLFNGATTTSNGGTPGADCDKQNLDSANKAACNHMAKLLNKMYQSANGSTKEYSEQIIKCVLLREYAKKLKEKAKEGGYCSIDDGLSKAFSNSRSIMDNGTSQCKDNKGNSTCFECKWDNTDELKSCTIPNGSGTKEEVKEKVELLLKDNPQTVDTEIEKTVNDMNSKNKLCERVKCATARWWNDKKNGGKPNGGTVDWKEVWEEVQKEITKLGQTMSNNGDKTLDNHCGGLDYKKKEVCLLFARGLQHMGQNANGKEKFFERTMMCAALNAYAKKIKTDAAAKKKNGTGSCDIDQGITQAFQHSKTIMGSGTSPCTDPNNPACSVCNEESFDDCSVGTEDVKNKLTKFLVDEDDKTGLKESLDKICLPCIDEKELCKRAECVAKRWVENGSAQNGKNLWEDDNGVKKELKELSKNIQDKKGNVETHCRTFSGEEKEVCKLIAAGLKGIYEIQAVKSTGGKITKKALEDQLFKRTMRCVLLNAFADKLESLPCKDEKKVKNAVDKAFEKNSDIRGGIDACKKDDDKCFTCDRFNGLANCEIGENGNKDKVKGKVEPMLEGDNTLKKQPLEKTICKPCTGEKNGDFCKELQCVAKKWDKRKNGTSAGNVTWENMKDDFGKELEALLTDMKTKQGDVATHCDKDSTGETWKVGDAAGEANITACKLVAAGLQHISTIKVEYSESGKDEQKTPYDNQEFKQFVSCLMLKAIVQKMKEQSPICYIEPGIKVATAAWKQIKVKCTKQPCIDCNLDEFHKYDECPIGNNATDKVKPTLESLLTGEKKNEVEVALMDITKTRGNASSSLCLRLQCLAPRVQASNNAEKFWKEGGEVADLWSTLSKEMTNKGKNGSVPECNTMDNGSGANANGRPATKPEKKACNYLHAGLKALYTPTATAAASSTPSGVNEKILDKNPLLKQTVGCLLLHAYAKKMKGDATCLVDSGIKKAFETYSRGLITNGSCNDDKGPCVLCHWNEKNYDDCKITTSGTSGNTAPTELTEKLTLVKDKITETSDTTLKEINKMQNLCDYIKCAAPNWFKSKLPTTTNGGVSSSTPATATKTWCDFWGEEGVKKTLQSMFQHMESEGKDTSKNNTNDVCKHFGDENPQSVERKACNHITAGLKYIDDIQPNGGSGVSGQDNQLLHQAVGCIALNMYADQLRDESDKVCPIGEDKIQEMFTKWNEKYNNNSSSSPPCNGGGNNNNNVCFKCTRQPNFNNCQLSVDKNLINTTPSTQSGQNCTETKDEVKEQMTKLLNNEDKNQSQSNSTIKSKINTTLTTITEMTSSFCTQVQCAIKKKLNSKNGQATSGGTITPSWSAIYNDAATELAELLKDMNDPRKQKNVDKYCDNHSKWNTLGHKEKHTNKAACLLFAAGLQHIYKNKTKDPVNGPSFGQTMGCLFLKEYAKQLKEMAEIQKKYKVHPNCSVDSGIDYAFNQSKNIMENATPPCDNNVPNSCFECKLKEDYNGCFIGNDDIGNKSKELLTEPTNKEHMEKTLENTVCPILLTDLLTPFLPLAPVSIGLSAMAYYLWKYFGPLGKGGPRFRRSPADIPGSSVQEQVLDHVQQDSSHEYKLVKERKPRSAPTRTKRSGPVNRRTIIEIHFEVLDECQKGDTQLNQKDFLELLVQEFMGSELMEEEQVPKEEVLMEEVPMESIPLEQVPMERVPSLASGFMV
ncbi:SICAvar, type I [Plasmodium knowlesi strain H]|uniref:SICAvar, type I n=3 Tax=Plasmodium knowlesi TaxID=5850 RepID=A0A679KS93_PLAKH|nr:SICAvar, type I [Plasmodium knowlesi strain H]OTN66616.1 SICAvar type I [Plasmodium knowlesi]CAA9986827.1 SICAvar, type I [Plasmodium knowlesi strain H]SBO25256.1 SICAvar, type I [Plasmodium knowlesi strain H]VVS76301.1 SICAvar, type I [Plasmodium knowlesi strain H]